MRKLVVCLLASIFFFVVPSKAHGIENPFSVPNNRFGVHILFPSELADAARLVNSNGGKWGYVTIPIQAGDRDLVKWQKFMDAAKKNQVIPIVRLATQGDYFNTKVWRKPTAFDVLDFANFLNSLTWPTKNRYIVVFNEVNRSDEWGGNTNPSEYADVLEYATQVFRARDEDFFIISAGLDNAAANIPGLSFDTFSFMRAMEYAVPGIFAKIDGLGSHSYPNPAFAKPPSIKNKTSVASFLHERSLVERLSGKRLPTFITETGWSQERVSDELASLYYKEVFETVWSDQEIVSITPFILSAQAGPFTAFSLLKNDQTPSSQYLAIQEMHKVQGVPHPPTEVLGTSTTEVAEKPLRDFSLHKEGHHTASFSKPLLATFKWLLDM